MKDNEFTIANGNVLTGYLRREIDESAMNFADKDVRDAEYRLLKANAHFLFDNKDRIYSDSRMFLAPINAMSGAAYIGALAKPILGTYLEWWDLRGLDDLALFVSGSPLSGASVSKAVARTGKTVELKAISGGRFTDLMYEFNNSHRRYIDERKKFESYSLAETIDILKNDRNCAVKRI